MNAERIGPDELVRLAERSGTVHVSLYAPMIRSGTQTEQNPIVWKNLLRQATDALRQDGVPRAQADAVLGPATALLNDPLFWEHQGEALAYFASPEWSRQFRLPIRTPQLAAIGTRFVVAPLLELLAASGRFLLLTLSQRDTKLFELRRFEIGEAPVELPAGIEPANAGQPTRGRPDAFVADRGGAGGEVVYFGQAAVADQRREQEILRYFRDIDAGVRGYADGDRTPLLLAGTSDLISLYRKASSYRYLAAEAVTSNASELSRTDLHTKAWSIAEPLLRRDEAAALAEYRRLDGTGMTISDPREVLAAAVNGRVGTLLLSSQVFERPPGEVETVLRPGADDTRTSDVLDQAVTACLAHGGAVYSVPVGSMPNSADAAALLRY